MSDFAKRDFISRPFNGDLTTRDQLSFPAKEEPKRVKKPKKSIKRRKRRASR